MLEIRQSLTTEIALERVEEETEFLSIDECAGLLNLYRTRNLQGSLEDDSVWAIHIDNSQKPFLDILAGGSAEQLHAFLNNIHYETVLTGYDQHRTHTLRFEDDALFRQTTSRRTYAALICFAAAIGTQRLYNMEQRHNFPYLHADQSNEILSEALNAIGIASDLPKTARGSIGIPTDRGILGHRHAIGLGYFRELRNILENSDGKYTQVVEIGGGLGRTAYHAAKDAGLAYTIIDIPAVGVTQYAFLQANGVPCDLWPDVPAPAPGKVNLVNAFSTFDARHYGSTLFVNFDSFVEMGRETQNEYFDLIRDAGGDLLSINHEARKEMTRSGHEQNCDIGRFADWGYHASPRMLFWERPGYIVQFFRNLNADRERSGKSGRWRIFG